VFKLGSVSKSICSGSSQSLYKQSFPNEPTQDKEPLNRLVQQAKPALLS